jgi:hypothetical protein
MERGSVLRSVLQHWSNIYHRRWFICPDS